MSAARFEHAMRMYKEYPYNRVKFTNEDLAIIRNFINLYNHLDRAEFELTVNRMFIDKEKPKNYTGIMELLTVCNTACYNTTPVKEVLMSTNDEAVTGHERAEAIAAQVHEEMKNPPSKTKESMAIGQAIKAKREALGLKREALAAQLGISVGYLGLIENGGPTWVSEKLNAGFASIGVKLDPATLAAKNAAAKAYDRAAALRAKANKAKAVRKAKRAKATSKRSRKAA